MMIYSKSRLNSIVNQVFGKEPLKEQDKITGNSFDYFVMEDNMESKIVNKMSDDEILESQFGNVPNENNLKSLGFITCTSYNCFEDYSTYEPTDNDLIFINYKSIKAFHIDSNGTDEWTVIDVGTEKYDVLDTPVEILNKIASCKDEEWKHGK